MNGLTARRTPGFTLLELLVALAIFSLLAVMAYGGLRTVLDQRAFTEVAAEQLRGLQQTYLVLQRDIEQVVRRPVRDEFGDTAPALLGDSRLQLTRGGWSNPTGQPRSTLQRVGYALEEQQWVRYAWQVLDRAQDSAPLRHPLTGHIEQLQLRYLGADNKWKTQWPPPLEPGQDPAQSDPARLPRAIEVTLEHARFGPVIWLFQVSQ